MRVQAKLKRLLAGSSLIMFAGFIAVFAAIFYKINSSDGGASGGIPSTISVGPDAVVEDMELIGGRLVLLVKENGKSALLHFDPSTGVQLGRTDLVSR